MIFKNETHRLFFFVYFSPFFVVFNSFFGLKDHAHFLCVILDRATMAYQEGYYSFSYHLTHAYIIIYVGRFAVDDRLLMAFLSNINKAFTPYCIEKERIWLRDAFGMCSGCVLTSDRVVDWWS